MNDSIRPSKVVMTHGAGSIIDLSEGRSALVMSPDYWLRYNNIEDRRLAAYLGVNHFRCPKDEWVNTENGWRSSGILTRQFPRQWYCPICRRLQYSDNCRYCKDEDKPVATVPPRLIAACEGGHISDFPWRSWVGCENHNHILELHPSDGESDLEVRCPTCASEKPKTKDDPTPGLRNLAGALGRKASWKCFGARPWIGDDAAKEDCQRNLHGLMRGGSNVYFPLTCSSILIPRYSWRIYQEVIDSEDLSNLRSNYELLYDKNKDAFDILLSALIDKYLLNYPEYSAEDFEDAFLNHCKDRPSMKLKLDEWNAFRDPCLPHRTKDDLDFFVEGVDISKDSFISKYFEKVIIVKRLTEVTALYGFTRIEPPVKDLQSSATELVNPAMANIREEDESKWTHIWEEMVRGDGERSNGYRDLVELDPSTGQERKRPKRDWLPGVKTKGEGIFLVFKKDRLTKWEENAKWAKRTQGILEQGIRTLSIMDGVELIPRSLLIHTFSHLLSKQIAQECGYQLASLRERLYSSKEDNLYGVLIYTSAMDSQGSLGGLISQAQDLDLLSEHVRAVIDAARACSQDPLCGMNEPTSTAKPWGASCHSCTHLPETSCEMLMNRFLDRHTISGDGIEKQGYFGVGD